MAGNHDGFQLRIDLIKQLLVERLGIPVKVSRQLS